MCTVQPRWRDGFHRTRVSAPLERGAHVPHQLAVVVSCCQRWSGACVCLYRCSHLCNLDAPRRLCDDPEHHTTLSRTFIDVTSAKWSNPTVQIPRRSARRSARPSFRLRRLRRCRALSHLSKLTSSAHSSRARPYGSSWSSNLESRRTMCQPVTRCDFVLENGVWAADKVSSASSVRSPLLPRVLSPACS